jgi:hypothetical protein
MGKKRKSYMIILIAHRQEISKNLLQAVSGQKVKRMEVSVVVSSVNNKTHSQVNDD